MKCVKNLECPYLVKEIGERKTAKTVLEALCEEKQICSLSVSPRLRGLCIAWNIALKERFSRDEIMFLAGLLTKVATDLWSED